MRNAARTTAEKTFFMPANIAENRQMKTSVIKPGKNSLARASLAPPETGAAKIATPRIGEDYCPFAEGTGSDGAGAFCGAVAAFGSDAVAAAAAAAARAAAFASAACLRAIAS